MNQESDSLFARNNATGSVGLKTRAWLLFKADNPETNLFDDFHMIYCQLKNSAKLLRNIDQMQLRSGITLSRSLFSLPPYTVLSRAGQLADNLEAEAKLMGRAWHLWCSGDYRLTPMIRGCYTEDQLTYRPFFIPGEDPETYRPFMSLSERKEDDEARAHKRALEIQA